MVTLGQLVQYVLDNRKGNAFKDYDELTIALLIQRAASAGTMLYSCDSFDAPNGIVVATKMERRMHINDILTTDSSVMHVFVSTFKQRWPECQLTATRKGHLVQYDTDRLCKKLMKGKI